nr:probable phospholipid-transporting ATPase IIB [Lytechinus pictus]
MGGYVGCSAQTHVGSEEDSVEDLPLAMGEDGFDNENESLTRRGTQRQDPLTRFLCNINNACSRCCASFKLRCKPEKELFPRTVWLGKPGPQQEKYPPNKICNQKYNIFTFIPLALYYQFKLFLNLYFLLMALSQLIPSLRIGYLYTYWAPLVSTLPLCIHDNYLHVDVIFKLYYSIANTAYDVSMCN